MNVKIKFEKISGHKLIYREDIGWDNLVNCPICNKNQNITDLSIMKALPSLKQVFIIQT